MQFENFDNKIREAADHHHPAYDEKAWEKMEKLLDKHLPQKEDDRRRIIFLLLLFVLLGGGTWFLLGRSGNPDKAISKTNQPNQSTNVASNDKKNQMNSDRDKISLTPNTTITNENNLQQKLSEDKTTTVIDRNKYSQSVVSMINDRLKETVRKNASSPEKINSGNKEQAKVNNVTDKASGQETATIPSKEIGDNKTTTSTPNTTNNNNSEKDKSNFDNPPNSSSTKTPIESVNGNKSEDADKKDVAKNANINSDSKKPSAKNKKNNYFFFSLSAGPDVSAAGINSIGKLKPVYGIGVGFSFHDKFTLRTGFYSARKIYTASPDEYHPPYDFWTYYPYLKKVNADCKVFEIPLTLSYNFSHSVNHTIFGTAGISSYLMKRETYNYISKLPSGLTTNRQQTLNNKNKHYFSVVTLSGGYERNLSKSVSIAAEPYVKIPVDGIGFGKVQLNSAGVLFSLLVKPFKESKKK